jgi:hypothetical protein
VIDVRSNSTTPLEQSEDQEDELLSIVSVKGYVVISINVALVKLTRICTKPLQWFKTRRRDTTGSRNRLGSDKRLVRLDRPDSRVSLEHDP